MSAINTHTTRTQAYLYDPPARAIVVELAVATDSVAVGPPAKRLQNGAPQLSVSVAPRLATAVPVMTSRTTARLRQSIVFGDRRLRSFGGEIDAGAKGTETSRSLDAT
jgi:hypothetical protein